MLYWPTINRMREGAEHGGHEEMVFQVAEKGIMEDDEAFEVCIQVEEALLATFLHGLCDF
ncbi:hypothetical protein E2542_SST14941 [Spatholobus suberectus]|nr:hypothetical protein E2542_SST14941 [Spatholobus suberectus]